jgi:hypothetical protein
VLYLLLAVELFYFCFVLFLLCYCCEMLVGWLVGWVGCAKKKEEKEHVSERWLDSATLGLCYVPIHLLSSKVDL